MAKIKVRRGAAAVIFRKKRNKEPEFLLLHRIKRWKGWEMLKGARRGKGGPLATLRRELMEEIGAKEFTIIGKLPFILQFKISKEHVKEMGFTHMKFPVYLVEYKGPIRLSQNRPKEHNRYKWATFKEALRLLTFNTSKRELKVAHAFMKSRKS